MEKRDNKEARRENSYVVETESGTYRRNRRHIRKLYEDARPQQSEPDYECHENKENENTNDEPPRDSEENSLANDIENLPVQDEGNQGQYEQIARTIHKTRSGRLVKPNRKYTENFV